MRRRNDARHDAQRRVEPAKQGASGLADTDLATGFTKMSG